MVLTGNYTAYDVAKNTQCVYGAVLSHTITDEEVNGICKNKVTIEAILYKDGKLYSAFKYVKLDRQVTKYAYNNMEASKVISVFEKALSGCTTKNMSVIPSPEFGVVECYRFNKKIYDARGNDIYQPNTWMVCKNGKDVVSVEAHTTTDDLQIRCDTSMLMPQGIEYIELTMLDEFKDSDGKDIEIPVRTLAEIALYKDITWLKNKKYFIVNDENVAEQLFTFFDTYNGPIAYDTETTGLKINMFGKINSKEKKGLAEYNRGKPASEQIHADELVGIILCVEENVSYYFPCKNRKFRNLYEDKGGSEHDIIIKQIERFKADYTIGKYRNVQSDMADYWRTTPISEVTPDCILMERVRNILSTRHIVTHNGTFDWKVAYLYDIDTNITDDTMLLHQLMYKFRGTSASGAPQIITTKGGASSALKSLTLTEFGIEQLDLKDFFIGFTEDDSNKVATKSKSKSHKKKKATLPIKIDFSYMDYEGARAYAPADGDFTLGLYFKYKKDLKKNHREMEYIYSVEMIVACAIGYMEFYGHRINEEKIAQVRDLNLRKALTLEHKIRVEAGMCDDTEKQAFEKLDTLESNIKTLDETLDSIKAQLGSSDAQNKDELQKELDNIREQRSKLFIERDTAHKDAQESIEKSANVLNIASPAQVATLFFETLKIPFDGDKPSVNKKVLKAYTKQKNEDGTPKYRIINLYSDWKSVDTLLTKFFDNLQDFMYPGGFIFSNFGQISTATGRMSCKKPNAQQYPKDITKIIIPRGNNVFIDADFSQIEYRVLVTLANEPKLKEAFSNPDNDYHTLMASLMYGVKYSAVSPDMRKSAKSFNFGIPYGMGFKSLAILLTGASGEAQVEEAKEKYELYFKEQPNVRRFFNDVKEMAQVNGFTKTYWNRYRYYSFTDKDGRISNKILAAALRQAGNAVIQGTAADIFKVSVARNFMWIRHNNLFGKVLIVNMIHDEQLIEVDCDTVNVHRALSAIIQNMEIQIEGFPPLFVGAGVSNTWATAKGSMAEIHPHLANQLIAEAQSIPLFIGENEPPKNSDIIKYFDSRVYNFRLNKVKDYLLDTSNYGQELHPVIGSLLNLQFTYGLDREYSGDELTRKILEAFIEKNNIPVSPDNFVIADVNAKQDDEADKEYVDGDEDDIDELLDIDDMGSQYRLVDDSNNTFGCSVQDLIREFGVVVSTNMRLCGIDSTRLHYSKKDSMIQYLTSHLSNNEQDGAMEVVFLKDGNILNRTGIYVSGITNSDLAQSTGLSHIATA